MRTNLRVCVIMLAIVAAPISAANGANEDPLLTSLRLQCGFDNPSTLDKYQCLLRDRGAKPFYGVLKDRDQSHKPREALVIPVEPVKGIENWEWAKTNGAKLWQIAVTAGENLPQIPANRLALAINSANSCSRGCDRSMDQLHIHAGCSISKLPDKLAHVPVDEMKPVPITFNDGHVLSFFAIRVKDKGLAITDPFKLMRNRLAKQWGSESEVPQNIRDHQSLAVVRINDDEFIVLNGEHANGRTNPGHSEVVLDGSCKD